MKRILVVDDDSAIRRLLRAILRRHGFTVEIAEDGIEALEKLKDGRYDAVVLDLMMPKADGWSVVGHLEAHQPDLLGRLVVLTASTEQDVVQARGRVYAAFRKPFEINDLLKKLDELTGNLSH